MALRLYLNGECQFWTEQLNAFHVSIRKFGVLFIDAIN